MRAIVVGDIHGCLDEFRDLLRVCGHVSGDLLISVGDLVAKGPDSAGVVGLARELGARAVQGNHDAHVVTWRDRTVEEARAKDREHHHAVARTLSDEDVRWLAELPAWMALSATSAGGSVESVKKKSADHARWLIVHAGLAPGVPLDQQDRHLCLTMRSIRRDGTPSKKIEGSPWAARWPGPQHVVFGHDAVRGLQEHPNATGLDTGCVYGGKLTALLLPEQRLVAVPARRAYMKW